MPLISIPGSLSASLSIKLSAPKTALTITDPICGLPLLGLPLPLPSFSVDLAALLEIVLGLHIPDIEFPLLCPKAIGLLSDIAHPVAAIARPSPGLPLGDYGNT